MIFSLIYFMLLPVDGFFFYLAKWCPDVWFLNPVFRLDLIFEAKMLVGPPKSGEFLVLKEMRTVQLNLSIFITRTVQLHLSFSYYHIRDLPLSNETTWELAVSAILLYYPHCINVTSILALFLAKPPKFPLKQNLCVVMCCKTITLMGCAISLTLLEHWFENLLDVCNHVLCIVDLYNISK